MCWLTWSATSGWTSASCGTTITRSTRRGWWRSGRSARTSPTRIRLPWCTSPTPTRSSPAASIKRNPSSSAPSRPPTITSARSRKAATSPRRRWRVCRCSRGTSRRVSWGSSSSATGNGHPKSSTPSRRSHRCSRSYRRAFVAEDQLRFLAEHDDLTGPQQPPRPAGPPRPAIGGRDNPAPSPHCSSTWTG